MPRWAEAQSAVEGAIAIVRRDPNADRFFDLSADSFWRSFGAFLYIAPLQMILVLAKRRLALSMPEAPVAEIPSATVMMVIELIASVIAWGAYPLAMFALAPQFGLAKRFASYVIVYNWTSLAIVLAVLPPYLLFALGVFPPGIVLAINFIILLAVLWFLWTLATDVLGAPGLTAAGFVVLDILLGLFISLGVAALIAGQPVG
jgi:hypothetical protein